VSQTIKILANGPYVMEGPLELVDPTGQTHQVEAGKKAALCRCGASTRKPFCDGTHSKIGFEAAEAAVMGG